MKPTRKALRIFILFVVLVVLHIYTASRFICAHCLAIGVWVCSSAIYMHILFFFIVYPIAILLTICIVYLSKKRHRTDEESL